MVGKYLQSILCLTAFGVFTGYVFVNARLKDSQGDMILMVLLLLVLPRFARIDLSRYARFFTILFWSFLALSLSSVLFPPSPFAKLGWLVTTLYRVLFSWIIVCGMLNMHRPDRKVLRWGLTALCLLLASCYIVQQQGGAIQETLAVLSPFRPDDGKWHHKNYAMWQLLLMWGAIAFLWQRNRAGTLAAVMVWGASAAAIFSGTGKSSQLALAISTAVFLFAHVVSPERRYGLYCVLTIGAFLLVPLLWFAAAPLEPWLGPLLPGSVSYTMRLELYDYSAQLIGKEVVLGHGFGSTLYMPIPKGEVGWRPSCFPGGHAHNLPLQMMIDHGLLGLIFLASVLSLFYHYIHHAARQLRQAPAVWALFSSGLILFSLSYTIWKADIVLMYCMWLALIFASCSRHGRQTAGWLQKPKTTGLLLFFGVTAVACYAADYLYLAGR